MIKIVIYNVLYINIVKVYLTQWDMITIQGPLLQLVLPHVNLQILDMQTLINTWFTYCITKYQTNSKTFTHSKNRPIQIVILNG